MTPTTCGVVTEVLVAPGRQVDAEQGPVVVGAGGEKPARAGQSG